MSPDASEARRDASNDASEPPEHRATSRADADGSFQWTSLAGIASLIREILLKWPIPFDPHEFLLEWTAHVLSGAHFFGITATGDGKSCMFYFALIVMLYYANPKNGPSPCGRSWPRNPLAIIVLPINAIEDELGPVLAALGFNVVVINSKTLERGARLVWASAAGVLVQLLILSPELLISKSFEELLNSDWAARVVYIVVDEAHLLLTWGAAFRKAFRQIGLLRARFRSKVQIIALSATVMPGREVEDICTSLGLRAADMQFDRRCNLRGNLALQRHVMTSALDGPLYPDLRWLVSRGLKAVVFCRTIARVWRMCSYLWNSLPAGPDRELGVRPYHSLNPVEYNAETRRLLLEHNGGVFVATTSALSVGVDLPRIDVVAVWGAPEDVNGFIQEAGRARRGQRNSVALGLVYVPATTLTRALAVVDTGKGTPTMSLDLARLLSADEMAPVIDDLYRNPPPKVCGCLSCDGHPISGAIEALPDGPGLMAYKAEHVPATVVETVKQKKPRGPTTKAMRALVFDRLSSWRDDVYFALPYESTMHISPCGLITDTDLQHLASKIFEIVTEELVHEFLVSRTRSTLLPFSASLHETLTSCRDDIRAEQAAKRAAKAAAKRAEARAAARADEDTDDMEQELPTPATATENPNDTSVAQDLHSPPVVPVPPAQFYALRSRRAPLQPVNTAKPVAGQKRSSRVAAGRENGEERHNAPPAKKVRRSRSRPGDSGRK